MKRGLNVNSARSSYKRGSSVLGNLHVLHPSTWQQHHLQVEQVSCQVACGLSGVKSHPRGDIMCGGGKMSCCSIDNNIIIQKIKLYPCFLAIISSRDFTVLIDDAKCTKINSLTC